MKLCMDCMFVHVVKHGNDILDILDLLQVDAYYTAARLCSNLLKMRILATWLAPLLGSGAQARPFIYSLTRFHSFHSLQLTDVRQIPMLYDGIQLVKYCNNKTTDKFVISNN
jgi:hypothetical protein